LTDWIIKLVMRYEDTRAPTFRAMYDAKMLSYQPKLNLVRDHEKREKETNSRYLRLGDVGDISSKERLFKVRGDNAITKWDKTVLARHGNMNWYQTK